MNIRQISAEEFSQVPLRVHAFMSGVPLHDVWTIELRKNRAGITLDEFLRSAGTRPYRVSSAARVLLAMRLFTGRLFGWDRESSFSAQDAFAAHLSPDERAASLVAPGTKDGLFRVVYRFENEQLVEIMNRTVHAAASSALVETTNAYRFYFGVYVQPISRFTPVYMAIIDPFRKTIVYPSLLRNVGASWDECFNSSDASGSFDRAAP